MASILDELTKVAHNRCELVVESDRIEDLLDVSVSHMVIEKAATHGLHRPGISNAGGPYPVDIDGNTDDELLLGKRGPVSHYRRDFVILAGL